MENINVKIEILSCVYDELNEQDKALVDLAKQATANSYSPYSHFRVGAAIRLSDDSTIIGANQENAAFPSGLCAERTALFAAQANHPDQSVQTLAIAARNDNGLLDDPVSPCGACRQVILGVEDRYKQPIRILLYGKKGVYSVMSAKDLLPLSFVDSSMK